MGDRKNQSGPRNSNWRGGRSVASNGYVLVRVGREHPLADVRGYAYEHRIVASEKLGRLIADGEIVHHIDGNKGNNSPANLEVLSSIAAHLQQHRSPGSRLRKAGDPNPTIACGCGCGIQISQFDRIGRPRRFVTGHNMKRSANG